MKVAIIHYWWLVNRGGESVASALLEIFPEADLFLHVYNENSVNKLIGNFHKGKIYTTFINNLPFAKQIYKLYLPLMPYALEKLDLSKYDLVISNESGPTKGVITRPDAIHICYQLSPMRYIWDMFNDYLTNKNFLIKIYFLYVSHKLRIWDRLSADRVDYFIAISKFIQKRIKKYYRIDASAIIGCPVNAKDFNYRKKRKNYYLYLGELVEYKKADVAVKAFNKLGLNLVVIGGGELEKKLHKIANKNIKILGRLPFEKVKESLEECKALIFPGIEDFGIVPLEAMAAGAPVIAYAKGGALDTVIHNKTGILYDDPTSDGLVNAVRDFEKNKNKFSSRILYQHALKFDKKVFKKKIKKFIDSCLVNINR